MPRNKENNINKRKKVVSEEDEDNEDYRKRRDRNNQVNVVYTVNFGSILIKDCTFQAVKKSRVKSKLRTQQTVERVNQLKMENELLEEKIKMLNKELGFLKDLFLAHAGKDPFAYANI